MSAAWTVAFAALFALNAVLAVVVLGVLRRTVTALEQGDQRQNPTPTSSTSVSQATHGGGVPESPSFDIVGQTVAPPPGYDWQELGDATVVFLEAGCQGCELLAVDATVNHRRVAESEQSLLFVVDSARGPLAKLPADLSTLTDVERLLSRAWGVASSPVAYLVSSSGFVIAASHPHSLQDVLDLKTRTLSMNGHLHGPDTSHLHPQPERSSS